MQGQGGEKAKEEMRDKPKDDAKAVQSDKTLEQMGLHRMKKETQTKFKGPKKGAKFKAEAKLSKLGLDKQLTLGDFNFKIRTVTQKNPLGNNPVNKD